MHFQDSLVSGVLQRRYKRFLADVTLQTGETVVAHCPNTGSMAGCDRPGSRVWLSRSNNPKRKLAYTWELVEVDSAGSLACINTGHANALVGELLRMAPPESLAGYDQLRPEVRYGAEKSRIDWLLEDSVGERPPVWLEVKNVTLGESGAGYFPDAVTARGQKHLRELVARVRAGDRAVIFFCVSHSGLSSMQPADGIDPVYGQLLREVVAEGVECLAWRARITSEEMTLEQPLPIRL